MSDSFEGFWANIPEEAWHPHRETILEAMLWIGEPLSAIQVVDTLDGDLSMWEVARHMSVLQALGVVEPVERTDEEIASREDGFDQPYRLKGADADDD